MAENNLTHKNATTGGAAVDGLFGGVVAGVLMAVYLVVSGLLMGEGAGTMLGRFAAGEATSPLVGALSYLAIGGVYGVLFALGWRLISRRLNAPVWLGGLAYAATLLIVAEVVVLPASDSPLREIPLVHFALAHGIYGLVLGLLVDRQRST